MLVRYERHLAPTCATRSSPSRTAASTRTPASTCAASAAPSSRTCSAASAVQGGSTIAQQFVKNALRAQSDRTVFQKMREAALAYHLTRKWSKNKILTEYLNSIYFGNGAYGVESAARTYFGNQPDHLDCGTRGTPCASRSSSPTRPRSSRASWPTRRAYDPVAHPQAAKARRNLVLKDMFDQGLLPRARVPPPRASRRCRRRRHQAAHGAVRGALLHDVDAPAARRPLRGAAGAFEGGLTVHTTLDLELQKAAEHAVNAVPAQRRRARPPRSSRSTTQTGEVRAMVGGARLRAAPVQPRHAGPAPAGLGDQAVHPGRGAARARAGLVWPSRKRVFTVPGTKGREKFVVNNFESKYAGHADARRRPHVLRQLRLLRGGHLGRARRRSPRWPSAWASARRSPRTSR